MFEDKNIYMGSERRDSCKTNAKGRLRGEKPKPTKRHRHLLNDLTSMLPHGRKDAKIDTKSKLFYLNEIAELYNCNNVLFFEARKSQDLYMWMSKAPNGPCIKLYVQNCTYVLFLGGGLRKQKIKIKKEIVHVGGLKFVAACAVEYSVFGRKGGGDYC